ncbi:MAG: LD-carboxypeptidase [Acidobacteria bacterium]|nr:MAG: LD-carboxypeptidase [Acidobacteriota bacterium]
MPSRRAFLGTTVAGVATVAVPRSVRAAARDRRVASRRPVIRPPRLEPGAGVGLINPCSVPLEANEIKAVRERVEALGLRLEEAPAIREVRESAEDRASDINAMFADDRVKALLPVRGGWGCARLLPHLDYKLITAHPKILMGYSDVAALLLGVNARTGLVTFHGPMGNSAWLPYTVEHLRRILFAGEAATLCATADGDPQAETPLRTITPGTARGRLVGGNLTVMASMVGSPYLGGSDDVILFLEEVREPISEVDRMLTTLEMAGILGRARGFVFGQCTSCPAPELDGDLTLDRVLDDHVRALGIPAWRGAPIGHVERQLTVPVGLPVEMDATRGTIRLLKPAVI